MNKILKLFLPLLIALLTLLSFSCKGKENKTDKNVSENISEKKSEEEKIKPIKVFNIDERLLAFYDNGKLADTMYVTATSGLRVRKGPSKEEEIIGKLPYRFPAKIVAVGEKAKSGMIQSYWVKVVMPDYSGTVSEPKYGWVFGEYLSQNIPELTVPDSSDALAAYISSAPFKMFNSGKSTFDYDGYDFWFYQDGTFEYFCYAGEGDISDKGNGTWKADTATHISIKSDKLNFNGFYVHNVKEDGFFSPYEDDPHDYGWAEAIRNYSYDFITEKMMNSYKYSYIVNEKKEVKTFAESLQSSYSEDQVKTLLASGVDLRNCFTSEYNEYWDPIRKKEQVQPLQLDISGKVIAFSNIKYSDEDPIGSYITPNENISVDVYSVPLKYERYKIGTFNSGEIGIIKGAAHCDYPFPVGQTSYKIINSANGMEGYVFVDLEYETNLSATIDSEEDSDGWKNLKRINANVKIREKEIEIPQVKHDKVAYSYNGKFFAYEEDGNLCVCKTGETEPFRIENVKETAWDFEENAVMKFSSNDEYIFIVTKCGKVLSYHVYGRLLQEWSKIKLNAADFTDVKDLFIDSKDEYFYVLGEKSKGIPVMVIYNYFWREADNPCYEIKRKDINENLSEYCNYSSVNFSKNNEAVFTVTNKEESYLVKINYNTEKNPVINSFKLSSDLAGMIPVFGGNDKGFILAGGNLTNKIVKLDEKGNVVKTVYGYSKDSKVLQCTESDKFVIYKKDMYSDIFDPYQYGIEILFYSKHSLNLLYTKYLGTNGRFGEGYFADNSLMMFLGNSTKATQVDFEINEDERVRVTPAYSEKVEKLCQKSYNLTQNDYKYFIIEFTPNGFYTITAWFEADSYEPPVGTISGVYEWKDDDTLILYNALNFSGVYNIEETGWVKDSIGEFYRNLPVIEKNGTLEIGIIHSNSFEGDEKIYCSYFDNLYGKNF